MLHKEVDRRTLKVLDDGRKVDEVKYRVEDSVTGFTPNAVISAVQYVLTFNYVVGIKIEINKDIEYTMIEYVKSALR